MAGETRTYFWWGVMQFALLGAVLVLSVSGTWHRPESLGAPKLVTASTKPITSKSVGPRFSSEGVLRQTAIRLASLHNDPMLISDAELEEVVERLLPRFKREKLDPNILEHALRVWGVDATFTDPELLSGREMLAFLADHARFVESWGSETNPLLTGRSHGVSVRWGDQPHESQHPDHWLACLSEAGIARDERVSTPQGRYEFADVLTQAARVFDPNHRETEWSALAFALWLPPTTHWQNQEHREINFDAMARQMMRGKSTLGACYGTHRLFTLAAFLQVDEHDPIFDPLVRKQVEEFLRQMPATLVASQHSDGYWTPDWGSGTAASPQADQTLKYRKVIATGHHLEWLAIAPATFHPPRENMQRAAHWLIEAIRTESPAILQREYMFYSHVLGALCLWRQVRPADVWRSVEHRRHSGDENNSSR